MKTNSKLFHFVTIPVMVLILFSCVQFTQQNQNLKPKQEPLVYGKNFYETMDLFIKYYQVKPDSAYEGSVANYLDRTVFNWGDRLFPDGDCRRMAAAIFDYTFGYEKMVAMGYNMTTFDPKWINLGPKGMPQPQTSNSNQHGIGQIHRLTLDPNYNGDDNRTIYACSSYGGLWKTTDDGMNWVNMNTDLLPFCSVADMCVNPQKTSQLFICTGYADDGFAAKYDPNWVHANPIFTSGIYRSDDGGMSWRAINKGFDDGFNDGGTCRRMIINPSNPDQVFVATTRGIYRTTNATVLPPAEPRWDIVLKSEDVNDVEFRGLAFKPNSRSIVYASGTDIYRSADGGTSWQSFTGMALGLDLRNYPNFTVKRINITVTPADAERLYAYIEGYKVEGGTAIDGALIAMYNGKQWQVLDERYTSGGTNLFTPGYIGIAVSPVNANKVYYGTTIVWGNDNIVQSSFVQKADYFNSIGFHADVHDLVFQKVKQGSPKLFCAHHGGVSIKDTDQSGTGGWNYRSEGLSVATMWAFDDSETNSKYALTAHQDCGINSYISNNFPNQWRQVKGGDGYSARINDLDATLAFFTGGNNFYRYNYSTNAFTTEYNQRPNDPCESGQVLIPKTFPMVNHPDSSMYFGFTEVFKRMMPIPPSSSTPSGEIWNLKSNICTIEPASWKRQITELAFCKSKSDIFYVVTGGQQNDPGASWHLTSGLYRGVKNTLNPALGMTFQRLTHPGENVDNDTLAIITSIAVDPNNANKIWIGYTGYWRKYKIWYSVDGGVNWTNCDPREELFNIPVNAVCYYKGRLYIGTDAGIFTSSDMVTWQKYGNFPNVRVTEMKINEALMKIKVATYGRGLWEGDLMPSGL